MGPAKVLIIFFAGGILSELVALAWQPTGAGNSIANFSLAASIAIFCLVFDSSKWVRSMAIIVPGAGIILLFLKDIHGAAITFGMLIALLFIWSDRRMLGEKR